MVKDDRLYERILDGVRLVIPPDATVAVISKGDGAFLNLDGRRAWHFPQADSGVYAGHHPADSADAIAHLEKLRAQGAEYLLIPETSRWWLEYYTAFFVYVEMSGWLREEGENSRYTA